MEKSWTTPGRPDTQPEGTSRTVRSCWCPPVARIRRRRRDAGAEDVAVAQHGHRAVLADHDHGRRGVVEAVATRRRVPRAAQPRHLELGAGTRHQADPDLGEHAGVVEQRRPVGLRQDVAQRGEVGRAHHPQRRGRREAFVERRGESRVGPVHERRPDAAGAEVVHGELEQRLEHVAIAELGARADRVDPGRHERLMLPHPAVPAEHATAADDADDAGRVALHHHRPERLGEHDEVALRSGRAVEHHPLVAAVDATQQPAAHPVGVVAGALRRVAAERPALGIERRAGRPRRRGRWWAR